ncbi:tumor protein p53-inducible nuclear protein 2 [Embiotoca jacksoni]|uniref:tumor protein p53-inducible nuclear protein 2 n=1 Tax=Embiotoca jacksoni TaxID=100190 RepID=UPI003704B4F8
MFRTISRLFFGGEEEAPEDVKSGEVVEEGWLVVTHQEAGSAETQDTLLNGTKPSQSTLLANAVANMETDCVSGAEPTVQSTGIVPSQATSGSFFQPKALAQMTQLTCIQKEKAWADRHHVSRNALQRQNRFHQGVQQHSFNLQQPGHRSLSH